MSISPASTVDTPIGIRNTGPQSGRSKIFTVTLANAPLNPTITAAEDPAGSHVTVTVTGTAITIGSQTGGTNRGKFKVKVTPPSGCGSPQFIYVDITS
jgi:hypothetical protein